MLVWCLLVGLVWFLLVGLVYWFMCLLGLGYYVFVNWWCLGGCVLFLCFEIDCLFVGLGVVIVLLY